MYFTDTEKGKVYISSTNNLIRQAVDSYLPDVLNWHDAAVLMACDGDAAYPSPQTIGYHFKLIRNAVRKGDLELVSVDCGTFNQGIDKSKFKIWLNKTNRWKCVQNTLLSNWWLDDEIQSEHPDTINWKNTAREIGQKWLDDERKAGKDPGVEAISKYVHGELETREILGSRGKVPAASTIKREALTGITGKPANGQKPIKKIQTDRGIPC